MRTSDRESRKFAAIMFAEGVFIGAVLVLAVQAWLP